MGYEGASPARGVETSKTTVGARSPRPHLRAGRCLAIVPPTSPGRLCRRQSPADGESGRGLQRPTTTSPLRRRRHRAVDTVTNQVLKIVADKTGYPQDMLDLELDLEADLGIDTVKQAETFAAIRQEYDIPAQQGLSLRDYPTLKSVVGFVYKMRPDLAPAEMADQGSGEVTSPLQRRGCAVDAATGEATSPLQPDGVAVTTVPAAPADGVTAKVLEIVAAKTGYPQDMLDLELDLEADLGVDTVKQAETFASIRQAYDIPPQQGLSLRDYPTLKSVVGFVLKMRPDLATVASEPAQAEVLPFEGRGAERPEALATGQRNRPYIPSGRWKMRTAFCAVFRGRPLRPTPRGVQAHRGRPGAG